MVRAGWLLIIISLNLFAPKFMDQVFFCTVDSGETQKLIYCLQIPQGYHVGLPEIHRTADTRGVNTANPAEGF